MIARARSFIVRWHSASALALVLLLAAQADEPSLEDQLFTAITALDEQAALAAIEKGANPNAKAVNDDCPALVRAAAKGQSAVVKALLAKGADTTALSLDGETSLIAATRHGHLESVQALIDHGADINAQGKHRKVTPLILAVILKDRKIVKALLDKGADPTKTDDHGSSALRYAESSKQTEIIALLNPKAEPAAPTSTPPAKESPSPAIPARAQPPSQLPIRKDEPAQPVAHADPQPRNALPTRKDESPPTKEDSDPKDAQGRTALMRAAMEGNAEVALNLLKKGAHVNVADNDGWTPLALASFQGNAVLVKLLLGRNAHVNAFTRRHTTPLIVAAGRGHLEVVEILLAARADAALKDADNKTALAYAKEKGHTHIVETLKKSGSKDQ